MTTKTKTAAKKNTKTKMKPGPKPGAPAVHHGAADLRKAAAFMASLPAKLKCPHCRKRKTKDLFGWRTMKRRSGSRYLARQSRCRACR